MFSKFVFAFQLFVLAEDNNIQSLSSQFVFSDEQSCRIVEALVHDVRDPNNCNLKQIPYGSNDSTDNLKVITDKIKANLKNEGI